MKKKYRKGTVAAEALSLILKVAFVRLNLLNVKTSYAISNKNSEALNRLFKFKKVGCYENLLMIDGNLDTMVVEVLDKESWMKRNR